MGGESESGRVGEKWVAARLAYHLAGDRPVECTLTRDGKERTQMQFGATSIE